MAFQIYASVGSVTTQLNDGAPFWLESAEGLSSSSVVRYEQRGPLQSGATDLGYRLTPREFTLNILFYAATPTLLDGYRDTLMATFKPLSDVSIFLSVRRDDDDIRTLTCHTVAELAIALVPEERPGNLHRATVKLRAGNPLFKANSVTSGSATFTGLTEWWLAGGAITSGSVRNHYEYPGNAPVTAFAGTITGDWAVAVVTAKETAVPSGTARYVWEDSGTAAFLRATSGTNYLIHESGAGMAAIVDWPGTSGYNYHVIESRSGTQFWRYWNNGTLTAYTNTVDGTATYDVSLRGSDFNWRRKQGSSDSNHYWTPAIRKASIMQGMSTAQLQALGPYMLDTLQGSVTLVNDGDVNAYPLITLRGPMADPVIVNQSTGGTLNLAGGTLSAVDTWTIDLRTGDKRIYNQDGANVLGSVATFPISMASFNLAPSPIVSGGTNVIVLTPGSVGSAAYFAVEITNRYLSF